MIAISDRVETIAHVIQVALTPVFLFPGIPTLHNVLSTRLGRVADRVDSVSERLERASANEARRIEHRLRYLRRRSFVLDAAVIMAGLAGMTTLLAAALLFVDGLRHSGGAALFVTFGLALLLTIGALAAFLYEMMLASIGIRKNASTAANDEAAEAAEPPEPDASGE
jgi:hypothetical protein